MAVKSIFARFYARRLVSRLNNAVSHPLKEQEKVFKSLIAKGAATTFGKDHAFSEISSYEDFKNKVPVRDYEDLRPYIERVVKGENDVLWPGRPVYLCKTSGTTSGAKYIPISKDSISNHIDSAKHALLCYIHETGQSEFVDGKMIFLQGSPKLEDKNGIPFGRLSGIVAHHVPAYLQKNRLPSFETNSIEDWEEKLDAVVKETMNEDMRLISGIPSWLQMYFEHLIQTSGKNTIEELFPNLSLIVHGGVNFGPYQSIFRKLIGKDVPMIETYPASEGFIAFQNSQKDEGLLLVVNHGIFYEFIPVEEFHNENPRRLSLGEVELGVNYVIILNTNAGLWGYNIGDTVKFTSLEPYKIRVTGRIKHFTSAFGEHVISEEVEKSISLAAQEFAATIKEFHVAPQVEPKEGLPYHEWLIEFDRAPVDMDKFAARIDESLAELNPYYRDLITGNILKQAVMTPLKTGAFIEAMRSRGKLGGQNKIPRLANDRSFAELLEKFKEGK
jgi:hypothetical protein